MASVKIPGGGTVAQSSGITGVLHSRPSARPVAVQAWLRQWISSSLFTGGGQGALAGTISGIVIAGLCWTTGSPLNWSLLLALAGAAGGLLRGWQPGYRLAALVDQYIGWKRFWEAIGLVGGAMAGSLLGLLMAWAVIPVILGLVLGAKAGMMLGKQIWKKGTNLGWERIWGAISALGAAGLGWGMAIIIRAAGLDYIGMQLAAGLGSFGSDGAMLSAMLFAGAICGGLTGGIAGLVVDLIARLARLTS